MQGRHQSRISKGRLFQRIKSLKDMHQDHACKQTNKEKKKKSKQIITKKKDSNISFITFLNIYDADGSSSRQ